MTSSPNFAAGQAPVLGLRPRNSGECVVSSLVGGSGVEET